MAEWMYNINIIYKMRVRCLWMICLDPVGPYVVFPCPRRPVDSSLSPSRICISGNKKKLANHRAKQTEPPIWGYNRRRRGSRITFEVPMGNLRQTKRRSLFPLENLRATRTIYSKPCDSHEEPRKTIGNRKNIRKPAIPSEYLMRSQGNIMELTEAKGIPEETLENQRKQ